MKTATVQEVGRDFPAILKLVEAGEEVQVARDGQPVAWPVRAAHAPVVHAGAFATTGVALVEIYDVP